MFINLLAQNVYFYWRQLYSFFLNYLVFPIYLPQSNPSSCVTEPKLFIEASLTISWWCCTKSALFPSIKSHTMTGWLESISANRGHWGTMVWLLHKPHGTDPSWSFQLVVSLWHRCQTAGLEGQCPTWFPTSLSLQLFISKNASDQGNQQQEGPGF